MGSGSVLLRIAVPIMARGEEDRFVLLALPLPEGFYSPLYAAPGSTQSTAVCGLHVTTAAVLSSLYWRREASSCMRTAYVEVAILEYLQHVFRLTAIAKQVFEQEV